MLQVSVQLLSKTARATGNDVRMIGVQTRGRPVSRNTIILKTSLNVFRVLLDFFL